MSISGTYNHVAIHVTDAQFVRGHVQRGLVVAADAALRHQAHVATTPRTQGLGVELVNEIYEEISAAEYDHVTFTAVLALI